MKCKIQTVLGLHVCVSFTFSAPENPLGGLGGLHTRYTPHRWILAWTESGGLMCLLPPSSWTSVYLDFCGVHSIVPLLRPPTSTCPLSSLLC